MPLAAMSAASSITLAACNSALEGIHPHSSKRPQHGPAFDQRDLKS